MLRPEHQGHLPVPGGVDDLGRRHARAGLRPGNAAPPGARADDQAATREGFGQKRMHAGMI